MKRNAQLESNVLMIGLIGGAVTILGLNALAAMAVAPVVASIGAMTKEDEEHKARHKKAMEDITRRHEEATAKIEAEGQKDSEQHKEAVAAMLEKHRQRMEIMRAKFGAEDAEIVS